MGKRTKQPSSAINKDQDAAIRHLAKAVGEVIESQLHAGGARNTRLASAELHLTTAMLALESEHEPDSDPDGDGKGNGD